MGVDSEPTPIDQQAELQKFETQAKMPVDDSKGLSFRDLKTEEKAAREQDQAKIAEVRVSLGLEQASEQSGIKQYLREYLGLKEGAVERIRLLKAKDLPENYQAQRQALHDERLDGELLSQ